MFWTKAFCWSPLKSTCWEFVNDCLIIGWALLSSLYVRIPSCEKSPFLVADNWFIPSICFSPTGWIYAGMILWVEFRPVWAYGCWYLVTLLKLIGNCILWTGEEELSWIEFLSFSDDNEFSIKFILDLNWDVINCDDCNLFLSKQRFWRIDDSSF